MATRWTSLPRIHIEAAMSAACFWMRGTSAIRADSSGGEPATTVELFQRDRLLFLAEFLKSWIAAQRIPDRIKSKRGRRNRHWAVKIPAPVGYSQQLG